jgi:hypothetical protein
MRMRRYPKRELTKADGEYILRHMLEHIFCGPENDEKWPTCEVIRDLIGMYFSGVHKGAN